MDNFAEGFTMRILAIAIASLVLLSGCDKSNAENNIAPKVNLASPKTALVPTPTPSASSTPKASGTETPAQPTLESEIRDPKMVPLVVLAYQRGFDGKPFEKTAVVYGGGNPGDLQTAGDFENGKLVNVSLCNTTTKPPMCVDFDKSDTATYEPVAKRLRELYEQIAPKLRPEAMEMYKRMYPVPVTGAPDEGHQRVAHFFIKKRLCYNKGMPKTYKLEVAPLTVLPFEKSVFSYSHSSELAVGTIVTVPFSGRTLQGIVLACERYPNEKPDWLKSILSAEDRYPLTEKQILLAREVSKTTFTPFGKVLKHFTPKKATARTQVQVTSPVLVNLPEKNTLQKITSIVNALKKESSIFVTADSQAHDILTLLTLIQEMGKENPGQVLVLVPDINTAVRLENTWTHYYPKNKVVGLYHTKTPGQYYEAWSLIQSNVAQIIIATRSGCFAPFSNLTHILQLDPSDEIYKQWDMAPRYHTQYVLPMLQSLWQSKLIQVGTIPSLAALQEKIPLLSLKDETKKITPEWINLRIERWQKNWGIFSVSLSTAIKDTVARNEQVVLFVHQGGLESFSVCTECRTVFRCPSCHSALKLTSSDHYHCKHCTFRSALFPQCPNCKSIHFKSVGYGTEKILKEVQKNFPGSTVEIADKKHLPDHKKMVRFLERVEKKAPDILIVTSSYLRFPPLSRVGLVAIIDADSLLNMPGFKKDEQFVETIEKAKSLLLPKGRLLVQTFQPNGDIFQKIEREKTLYILENLLNERIALHYPPAYRCIALEPRPKQKEAQEKLKNVTTLLKTLLTKTPELKKKVSVQSVSRKERGLTKNYTLLRYREPLNAEVVAFLAKHADTILIDHDPLHIT